MDNDNNISIEDNEIKVDDIYDEYFIKNRNTF